MPRNQRDHRIYTIPNTTILNWAHEYHSAAKFMHDTWTPGSSSSRFGGPIIMTGTFSLELYLKSLNAVTVLNNIEEIYPGAIWSNDLSNESLSGKEHNPSRLFEAVPQRVQSFLLEIFRTSPLSDNGRHFLQDILKVFDGAFVKWRYVFEGHVTPLPLTDLFTLLDFFSGAADQIKDKKFSSSSSDDTDIGTTG